MNICLSNSTDKSNINNNTEYTLIYMYIALLFAPPKINRKNKFI